MWQQIHGPHQRARTATAPLHRLNAGDLRQTNKNATVEQNKDFVRPHALWGFIFTPGSHVSEPNRISLREVLTPRPAPRPRPAYTGFFLQILQQARPAQLRSWVVSNLHPKLE